MPRDNLPPGWSLLEYPATVELSYNGLVVKVWGKPGIPVGGMSTMEPTVCMPENAECRKKIDEEIDAILRDRKVHETGKVKLKY